MMSRVPLFDCTKMDLNPVLLLEHMNHFWGLSLPQAIQKWSPGDVICSKGKADVTWAEPLEIWAGVTHRRTGRIRKAIVGSCRAPISLSQLMASWEIGRDRQSMAIESSNRATCATKHVASFARGRIGCNRGALNPGTA